MLDEAENFLFDRTQLIKGMRDFRSIYIAENIDDGNVVSDIFFTVRVSSSSERAAKMFSVSTFLD